MSIYIVRQCRIYVEKDIFLNSILSSNDCNAAAELIKSANDKQQNKELRIDNGPEIDMENYKNCIVEKLNDFKNHYHNLNELSMVLQNKYSVKPQIEQITNSDEYIVMIETEPLKLIERLTDYILNEEYVDIFKNKLSNKDISKTIFNIESLYRNYANSVFDLERKVPVLNGKNKNDISEGFKGRVYSAIDAKACGKGRLLGEAVMTFQPDSEEYFNIPYRQINGINIKPFLYFNNNFNQKGFESLGVNDFFKKYLYLQPDVEIVSINKKEPDLDYGKKHFIYTPYSGEVYDFILIEKMSKLRRQTSCENDTTFEQCERPTSEILIGGSEKSIEIYNDTIGFETLKNECIEVNNSSTCQNKMQQLPLSKKKQKIKNYLTKKLFTLNGLFNSGRFSYTKISRLCNND